MTDTNPQSSPSIAETTATESKAQREARIRRERRNAKLQAGGSERLSKITSLSGRPNAAEAELNRTPSKAPPPAGSQPTQHTTDDPAEVDISNMFSRPQNANNAPDAMQDNQDILRQLLRQPPPGIENEGPGIGGDPAADPLMQMMQQMLGGQMPGADGQGAAPGAGGLPPNIADLLNGQLGGGPAPPTQPATSGDYLWRIVHAVFSILLGLYAVTTLQFTGTKFARNNPLADWKDEGSRLFYLFASAEVVLQSTRYFIDKGALPQAGWMGTVAGFLPPPWGGYLRVLSRYSVIYTTVSQDAFVVLFVLGAVAWWNGA